MSIIDKEKNKEILDEINIQLSDIKNYAEWTNESVKIIEKCLSKMEKK